MASHQDHDGTQATSIDPSHELPAHASPDSTGGGEKPSKSGWTRLVVIILIVCAATAFVVYRIRTNHKAEQQQNRRSQQAADRPVPVAMEAVAQQDVPVYMTALGTVTAYNTVTIKSRVDGAITAINFREGQAVKQGQLLIQIDPRPYQATLDQAKGTLARDEANARFAQAETNRYSALYQAGVVSRESAQTQESTAGQAAGSIAADRAAIQAAQVNLNYTHITAPISGVVGLRQVDIGNIVTAAGATPLLVLTQVQPIAVVFTLPEDNLPDVFDALKHGKTLQVEAWDRSNTEKLASGQLLTVDNQIDTTTGTAKLKAVFPNADNALYPNQFVNIRLITTVRHNAVTIPSAAVQTGATGNFVYTIDTSHPISADTPSAGGKGKSGGAGDSESAAAPSTGEGSTSGHKHGGSGGNGGGGNQTAYLVHATPIVTHITQGTLVIVDSGLTPGQNVVIDGQEKLRDGSKVVPHKNDAGVLVHSKPAPGADPNQTPNPNAQAEGQGMGQSQQGTPTGAAAAGQPGTGAK